MSEREAFVYGTKHKTEKIRPPSFKNLVDFLSLSFDGDDSDKLLLKLNRRVSFTSFDLSFASSYFVVVVVCVLSLFLSKMMMRARRVEERACLLCRNTERKRERKEGETRFNWPESPFTERERFPSSRRNLLFFSFFVLQFFFLARTERRTLLTRESSKDHRRVHSLSHTAD